MSIEEIRRGSPQVSDPSDLQAIDMAKPADRAEAMEAVVSTQVRNKAQSCEGPKFGSETKPG